METFQLDNLTLTINKKGGDRYSKVSYPARYGRYAEIRHPDYLCHFNLKGEIRHLQGLGQDWPHPAEWLKRTIGNDWLYYSSGGYGDIFDLLGEYYIPCFSYASNSIFTGKPFQHPAVQQALQFRLKLSYLLKSSLDGRQLPDSINIFLQRIIRNSESVLTRKAHTLHSVIQGRIPVLPPDSRHVDYEVIPVIIADGCLHNCGFCEIKTGSDYIIRSKQNILRQLSELQHLFGKDITNYNAIFLGQHDALAAGADLIRYAALKSYDIFRFNNSHIKDPSLFLFGSVKSFNETEEKTFDALNRLPYTTYINIGFESADQETLNFLRKPVSAEDVRKAFCRMLVINRKYEHIEISANFILMDDAPPGHHLAFIDMMQYGLTRRYSKGALYLSPLKGFHDRKNIVKQFHDIRKGSMMPVYFYLIQRL
jgi:hypothetical protein